MNTRERHARELIIFADGLEQAGFGHLARRARVVARDALELLEELKIERIARRRIQADRDRLLEMAAAGTLRTS